MRVRRVGGCGTYCTVRVYCYQWLEAGFEPGPEYDYDAHYRVSVSRVPDAIRELVAACETYARPIARIEVTPEK
jgi:ABC-type ATPase with predicted acetyltransferase domain